jgi:transcription termination factor NusB
MILFLLFWGLKVSLSLVAVFRDFCEVAKTFTNENCRKLINGTLQPKQSRLL